MCSMFVNTIWCLQLKLSIHEAIICTADGTTVVPTVLLTIASCNNYVILCLRSSNEWRRWLDGPDWSLTRALILLVETYLDVGQSCDQRTRLTTKSCPIFHISLVTHRYSHTNSAVKRGNIWSKVGNGKVQWHLCWKYDTYVWSNCLFNILPQLCPLPCIEWRSAGRRHQQC